MKELDQQQGFGWGCLAEAVCWLKQQRHFGLGAGDVTHVGRGEPVTDHALAGAVNK